MGISGAPARDDPGTGMGGDGIPCTVAGCLAPVDRLAGCGSGERPTGGVARPHGIRGPLLDRPHRDSHDRARRPSSPTASPGGPLSEPRPPGVQPGHPDPAWSGGSPPLEGVRDVEQFSMAQVSIENQALNLAAVDPATYRNYTRRGARSSRRSGTGSLQGRSPSSRRLKKK